MKVVLYIFLALHSLLLASQVDETSLANYLQANFKYPPMLTENDIGSNVILYCSKDFDTVHFEFYQQSKSNYFTDQLKTLLSSYLKDKEFHPFILKSTFTICYANSIITADTLLFDSVTVDSMLRQRKVINTTITARARQCAQMDSIYNVYLTYPMQVWEMESSKSKTTKMLHQVKKEGDNLLVSITRNSFWSWSKKVEISQTDSSEFLIRSYVENDRNKLVQINSQIKSISSFECLEQFKYFPNQPINLYDGYIVDGVKYKIEVYTSGRYRFYTYDNPFVYYQNSGYPLDKLVLDCIETALQLAK